MLDLQLERMHGEQMKLFNKLIDQYKKYCLKFRLFLQASIITCVCIRRRLFHYFLLTGEQNAQSTDAGMEICTTAENLKAGETVDLSTGYRLVVNNSRTFFKMAAKPLICATDRTALP